MRDKKVTGDVFDCLVTSEDINSGNIFIQLLMNNSEGVSEKIGIPFGHDKIKDIVNTLMKAKYLIEKITIKDNENEDSINEDYLITFGKYNGKMIKDIPENYLVWIYENTTIRDKKLLKYISDNINRLKQTN